MSNPGVAPPDLSSSVGKVRVQIGDTGYTDEDQGIGQYSLFSDDEIEVFLDQADGSIPGAVYFAYAQMAGAAAREAKSVKDLDLQVDLTKRASELRAIASMWKEQWESAASEVFEIFDIGLSERSVLPEWAPLPRRGISDGYLF